MIKMKKQNIIPIIALLALVSMMIVPVSAETLTGTLGSSSGVTTQTNWTNTGGTGGSQMRGLFVNDIENSGSMSAIIWYPKVTLTTDVNATTGSTTPFTAYLLTNYDGVRVSQTPVATGTLGYQKIYNTATPPVEQTTGYIYAVFNYWNISTITGDKYIELEYSKPGLYNLTQSKHASNEFTPSGAASFLTGTGVSVGDMWNTKTVIASGTYVAVKPSGLGISGNVTKTGNSRIFIQNSDDQTISSDNLANGNTFSFNVNTDRIYIKLLSPLGTWYNSSLLFTSATPTPTTTPAPTTTIPAGYVRNNLYIWDQNDAQISGADVDVRDVEAGTWTNPRADADGWITIDTLPYHTVNVYAHYPTAGIYLPNEILGLETGYYGGHNWVIVLYPYTTTPAGFVTLYINTRNYDTKAVLTGVNLQIKNLVTGAITGESTGSTDSVSTVVTNATNYQITGSKSGYLSKTININSGEASSKTVVVELSKATVTTAPTSTIPPGGVTPVITQDPNDPSLHGGDTSLKAGEMMTWLAMHGMDLVQLCFLVTVFALLGVKLGK
jgi:hypothetical protein